MQSAKQLALVTGAGRGIGRAIAIELARRGYALALLARSKDELDSCAAKIDAVGGRAEVFVCDVTDAAAVQTTVRECQKKLGPISRLINNAGCVKRAALAEMPLEDFDAIIACNLRASLICSQAALPDLRAQRGRIVNIASISAKLGSPMLGAYSAAKAGLVAMSKSLAHEEAAHGVLVFSVLPGSVDTRMLRQGLPGAKADMSVDEVAGLVAFLCDEAPAAMSGSAVEIFG